MEIRVDLSRCQGHARCLENAPAVFGYDDETNQSFVHDDVAADVDTESVLRAVEGCPEAAISIVHQDALASDA